MLMFIQLAIPFRRPTFAVLQILLFFSLPLPHHPITPPSLPHVPSTSSPQKKPGPGEHPNGPHGIVLVGRRIAKTPRINFTCTLPIVRTNLPSASRRYTLSTNRCSSRCHWSCKR